MMQPHDSIWMNEQLQALMDGELDGPSLARVQAYLATHPQAGEQLAAHLLLKQHVGKVLAGQTQATPPALRDQIAHLLAEAPMTPAPAISSSPNQTSPARPAGGSYSIWTRWLPPAMAAAVFIGASIMVIRHTPTDPALQEAGNRSVFATLPANQGQNPGDASPITQPVLTTSMEAPVAYAQLSEPRVQAMGKRHNTCSKKLEALYRNAEFPHDLSAMPTAIAGCVGKRPKSSLDLSRMGYEFTRAGQCDTLGERAVHMVYQAKGPDGDSVSLWVVPYHDKPAIREGVVYQGNVADSDVPVFFWRKDDLVYYLVGNSFDRVRTAAQNLIASR